MPTQKALKSKARLLWDKGGLWSYMAFEAISSIGLDILPITAHEIAQNGLNEAQLLVVPGGPAAQKYDALGQIGREKVVSFVERGGYYLGICGGAGLALSVKKGLGLVKAQRTSGPKRLASISGPIYCKPSDLGRVHPLWQNIDSKALFHVWWPGQFDLTASVDSQAVAYYHKPAPGFCTSDLVVDQVNPEKWPELEKDYGISLNPASLQGLAAVVSATKGKGELLLSYLHLDTPLDPTGKTALKNLWKAWLGQEPDQTIGTPKEPTCEKLELFTRTQELWDYGEKLGLWQKRHPFMPLWKRGARGLEFFSLLTLCRAACDLSEADNKILKPCYRAMRPIWDQGKSVLAFEAQNLFKTQYSIANQTIEEQWFPQPRRTGGNFFSALYALEQGVLRLIYEKRGNKSSQTFDMTGG